MDAEAYVLKDNKTKRNIVKKLTKRVFLCAMKRGLWSQQNTVTLSVLALKPVSPNDIISGHKFIDGAFIDIRKSIKQEPMDDGGFSASNASTTTKRKRKGKGKRKSKPYKRKRLRLNRSLTSYPSTTLLPTRKRRLLHRHPARKKLRRPATSRLPMRKIDCAEAPRLMFGSPTLFRLFLT